MSVAVGQTLQRQESCRNNAPVAASTHLYEGTLAFLNASGYLDDDTASGVNAFAGLNIDDVDNSSGSNGDKKAELYTEDVFVLTGSGFAQTSVGKRVYATDNYTVTIDPTAANAVFIGWCRTYVSSTQIGVELEVEGYKLGVVPGAAFTQTYSTAARTVPAEVAAIAGGESPTEGEHNLLVADVLALKKLVNALIDDLQAAGISG